MSTENNVYQNNLLKIVHFVGIVFWTILFFLGFNFWVANYLVAVPVALALGGLLGVFVFFMCKYRPVPSSVAILKEKILLSLYIVVSIFSLVFIYHMVTIAATEKAIITSYACEQKAIIDHYFSDENIDGSYLYFIKKRFEHKQMTNPKEDWALFEDELKGGAVYGDELHSIAYPNFNSYCSHITSWNWFTVSDYLPKMEAKKHEIEARLLELSQKPELVGNTTYEEFIRCTTDSQSSKLRNLTHNNGDYFISALLVIVLQGMMLWVYFAIRPREKNRNKKEEAL